MDDEHPRMGREARTMAAMMRIYCCDQHQTRDGLCPECAELLAYANQRLDKCPFQEGKTTCARCPVHCYKPDMRARVRAVMRYAGPRMLYHHPILTIWHLLDGRRAEPIRVERKVNTT